MENTLVPRNWIRIPPGPKSDRIPHEDLSTSTTETLVVQILHSKNGNREFTSYSDDIRLSTTLVRNTRLLQRIIQEIPNDIPEKAQFQNFLAELASGQATYRKFHSLVANFGLTENGTKSRVALEDFCIKLGQETPKYPHSWRKNPGSTVFAYQGALGSPDNLRNGIYHYRDSENSGMEQGLSAEGDLQRNVIQKNNLTGEYHFGPVMPPMQSL